MTVHLHKSSEKIRIKRGVRQGDTTSPKLFTATLESIFRRLNWENKGVKIDGEDEHRKDKGDGCRQHPNKREQCADRTIPRLRVLGTTLQPQRKEPGQRDTTKNHGRLGGIRQRPGHLQKQPCHLPEETGVQLLCAASYDIWCRDLDTDQTSTEQI